MVTKKITLLRHGPSDQASNAVVTATEFRQWVQRYEQSSIRQVPAPPSAVVVTAGETDLVVSSPAPRCIASAAALGLDRGALVDPVFRECEMPAGTGSRVRLRISSWSILYRLRQICGYSADAESFAAIRQRSRDGAARLTSLTDSGHHVLLIGHGAMNWLIQRELKKHGWRSDRLMPGRYWQMTTLSKDLAST